MRRRPSRQPSGLGLIHFRPKKRGASGTTSKTLLKFTSTTNTGYIMKVLIYSSKAIYDKASFDGRAEADLIAYAIISDSPYDCDGKMYQITKDRHGVFYSWQKTSPLRRMEFVREIEAWERQYDTSPYIPDMPS